MIRDGNHLLILIMEADDEQVIMVSEGWRSEPHKDKSTNMQQSGDPNRKDILIISAIQLTERKNRMEIFEIIRNSDDQVLSLEKFLPDAEKKMRQFMFPFWMPLLRDFKLRSEQNITSIALPHF
jgi:hypothetical protein